jgi:large subunit ribosomal protein L15
MQIHNIKRAHPNKKARTVGRGGVHGKTSGRGTKGQNARAGHKKRPELRDIIKKLPKKRGYGKNRATSVISSLAKAQAVNVSVLEKVFTGGGEISPAVLAEKHLIQKIGGKLPEVKILGDGEITKKFQISRCKVSASAKEKIEKAGGKVA